MGIRICRRPASLQRPLQAIMNGMNGVNRVNVSSQRDHTPYANHDHDHDRDRDSHRNVLSEREKVTGAHTLPHSPINIA